MMSSRLVRVAAASCALAAGAAFFAAPASAASTWTVTAGSATAGKVVTIMGATQGASPQISFSDPSTGQTLTCASGTAQGTTTVGSGLAGAGIGKITGANSTFTGCKGPGGLDLTVKPSKFWSISAQSYNSGSGVTTGHIRNIKAVVVDTGTNGGICSFTVTGAVGVTYTNSTQILSVPGTTPELKVSNANCLGAVNSGDLASFKADYLITAKNAAFNPIAITSP
jgi:hypothetical protein